MEEFIHSLTNWNIEYLKAVVEKNVYRNVISKEFLDVVNRLPPDGGLTPVDRKMVLSLLFTKPETMFLFHDPDWLLGYLFRSQYFPNNSQFYGCGLNYVNEECILSDRETKKKFISKQDALSWFYSNSSDVVGELGICARLTEKSVLNEIGRRLEGTFELIPFDLLEEHVKEDLQIVYPCTEDGFGIHSLFNEEFDDSLIDEFAQIYPNIDESKSLEVLQEMYDWRESVTEFFRDAPWFDEKYAILRKFEDSDKGDTFFFMAKEVEDILGIVMMKKYSKPFPKGLIPVENEEDRRLGILRTVEMDTFHKVLRILKLEEKDMTILPVKIHQSAPTNTPYGTYCKLSRHTFLDLFEQISTGMNLWRKIDRKNVGKIAEFFESLISEGVFSTQRNYRYCIETWKFDEILKRAFDELGKLVKPDDKCHFEIRDPWEKFSRQKSLEIMRKMAPHAENQKELREDFEFYMKKFIKPDQRFLEAEDVYGIFHRSLFNTFIRTNLKVMQFLEIQGFVRNVAIRGKNLEEEEELPFQLYVEKFREAFLRYLPKIPLVPILKHSEMMASIDERMGEYNRKSWKIQKSDRKAALEISKIIEEHVERHRIGDEFFVNRRVVPIEITDKHERVHDIFAEDAILNSIVMNARKNDYKDGSYLKLIRERLEEKLSEEIEEDEHRTIISMLENSQFFD
ncbi:unnamed protein product [Caenorhabditis angaria]|uniref:Uncharacterized protein n=1 Tax=Caenorhabditis angaria TaxID=860376 RepID=A0A9P1MW19_9PELO|nr:unnamed protein product [Caenorhabditis angaria]